MLPVLHFAFPPCLQVHTGELLFEPGSREKYSSTNFILLGLLLAQQKNGANSSWEDYDQRTYLETGSGINVTFAAHGAPKNYTRVRGYDRTSYNGEQSILSRFSVDFTAA